LSDREALALLFTPGFSTARDITNLSGRGVGLDVVRSNVERIGGTVDVVTKLGEGTTIKLKIPLTLAIVPGLLVTCGGQRFVIPQVNLRELIGFAGETARKIEFIHNAAVYRHRGRLLPVAYLTDVLGLPAQAGDSAGHIVVMQVEDRQFGLVVDDIGDMEEIVLKPLGKQLKGLNCFSGAAILGDGEVALILDALGVGQLSGVLAERTGEEIIEAQPQAQPAPGRQRLLLFRAGSFERLAVPLSLVSRLEEFAAVAIEAAGGRHVVQYRNRILPLLFLAEVLEPGSKQVLQPEGKDAVQVVVFGSERPVVGLAVDQVIDIVEETVTVRRNSVAQRGLLGSAVIGAKVTDFLDLHSVLQAGGAEFHEKREPKQGASTLLLAESSPFSRGLLRNELEMAGYRVDEAGNPDEILQRLEHETYDLLVADLNLFSEEIGRAIAAKGMRALALAANAEEIEQRHLHPGFDGYQMRFEREALLRSIERLAGPGK